VGQPEGVKWRRTGPRTAPRAVISTWTPRWVVNPATADPNQGAATLLAERAEDRDQFVPTKSKHSGHWPSTRRRGGCFFPPSPVWDQIDLIDLAAYRILSQAVERHRAQPVSMFHLGSAAPASRSWPDLVVT